MPWNPAAVGSTSQQDPDTVYPAAGASTFLPSAARTTSGNSSPTVLDCSNAEAVALELNISAVSGTTPQLVVTIHWSNDGTNWQIADPNDEFAPRTVVDRRFKNVTVKARYMRLGWTISGTTPSFTFEVKALVLT